MVVVPAGEFTMGSPADEKDRSPYNEDPRHKVTIPAAFAVSKFEITRDQWTACFVARGCANQQTEPAGREPVRFISWDDAKQYVAWLSQRTGQRYRLLSEAEWEYAARAGSQTTYPWGNEIGTGNANCRGCGSQWGGDANSSGRVAPVGSFPPNAFGLYDMHGNISEWVEDCYHSTYQGAPTDGTAWAANCATDEDSHILRGGYHDSEAKYMRSAVRDRIKTDATNGVVGFRVARTLAR
jgi:formylglycine-generating enzyme required for sulfatase activity